MTDDAVPTTRVTFPLGDVAGRANVLRVVSLNDGAEGVVVDVTPYHPLDHTWPDQPGDVGGLVRPDGGTVLVVDSLTGATNEDATDVLVGEAIDVRRGDPARQWYVIHVLDPRSAGPAVGERVTLVVDTERRAALSRGHTACHLAAFALNEVAADCWTKEPERLDSRGNPDLDQSAITVSRIEPNASFDSYRCGKSLRRKGFDAAAFLDDLGHRQDRVQSLLDAWCASEAAVEIVMATDDLLTSRRRWECALPEGAATVPCGGTHVASLADLGSLAVSLTRTEDGFEMRTAQT